MINELHKSVTKSNCNRGKRKLAQKLTHFT